MKIAVPGTRTALEPALLAKISIGMDEPAILARISERPLAQVVSKVKMISPITSGTQPPLGTLIRFAPK